MKQRCTMEQGHSTFEVVCYNGTFQHDKLYFTWHSASLGSGTEHVGSWIQVLLAFNQGLFSKEERGPGVWVCAEGWQRSPGVKGVCCWTVGSKRKESMSKVGGKGWGDRSWVLVGLKRH
jgi:hypothetical protein